MARSGLVEMKPWPARLLSKKAGNGWPQCTQIDCIDPLPGWDPGNPSAIYATALGRTR